MSIVIDEAIEYIKQIFENEYSGHDYFHAMRVYKLATTLAKEEKADMLMVQLAALLHDVDDQKLSPGTHESKERAVAFLRGHGIDEITIGQICQIISEVSFAGRDSVVPMTMEGKCVQDADRLDAIGAIGIARAFAYGGNHNRKIYDPEIAPCDDMSASGYYAHESTSINHFYEKLFKLEKMMNTDAAKVIAKQRTKYMHDFVDEFMQEWEGKC